MNPKVGIFFIVDGESLVDAVPLEAAEPYGDALQHGGHYEFWESLVPEIRVTPYLIPSPSCFA